MNEELIKFIELCLMDGVISDKEREVIFRKSKELGVPDDECEILIDSLVSKYSKKTSPPKPTKKKGGFFSSMFNEIKKNIDTDSIKSSFNKVKDDIKKGNDIEKEKIEKELKKIREEQNKTTSSNKNSKTKKTSPKSVNTNKLPSPNFCSCDEVTVIIKPKVIPSPRIKGETETHFYDLSGNRVTKIPRTKRNICLKYNCYLGLKNERWVEINPDEVENKLNNSEFIEVHSLDNKLKTPSKKKVVKEKSIETVNIEGGGLSKKDIIFEHIFKDEFEIGSKTIYIESFKLIFTNDEVILMFNQDYHKFSKLLVNPVNTDFFPDNSDLFIEKNKCFVGEQMITIINDNKLFDTRVNKIIYRKNILSLKNKEVGFEYFELTGSGFPSGNLPEFKFDDRYNRGGWFHGRWGEFWCHWNLEIFSLFNIPSRIISDTKQNNRLVKTVNLILKHGIDKYKTSTSRLKDLKSEVSLFKSNPDELVLSNNIFYDVLKNNQTKISEFNQEYIQKFIKLNNYLNQKSSNLLIILEKTISNLENVPKETIIEREKEIEFFKGLVYSYNLMVNHSIVMLTSLVENDMITFYEIYEVFDKMNVFNTNWENEVNNKLSEINESLQDLNFSIRGLMNQMRSMERNVVNGLQSINTSIGSLENSVNKQLSETNSRLKYENLTNYYKKSTIPGSMDWFDGPSS